jgi:DMSO/TMAO reductase YedYZ molybdopterin-dependent catalytic subunit
MLTRIPPGQRQVRDFPVLDLGIVPDVPHDAWRLRLFGRVAREVELDWAALMALPQRTLRADFHCVTHWSRLDLDWEGVPASAVLDCAAPLLDAAFVTLHADDGYTTNLPAVALRDADVLLAHGVDGGPLAPEHGGPVRLVVPRRYAWKSAKWLCGIEFHTEDRPGYWEVRGYHNDADPWKEERYAP